ncbi:MAG: PHP domain-containing protein [bacterium]|nr:PHP domain-containing protein [bacterium]
MLPLESLHTHTTLSDGKLTHREMFELAQSLGIAVIAFTDHDAVPSPETMSELETWRHQKTKWIVGIEMTADLPSELKPDSGTMHIIGLFVDPQNEALRNHCTLAQGARVRRMQKIVGNLQNLGFRINDEDCFEMSGGESVGRPHIIRALAKYPENNLVMEKIRKEMADEASRDPIIQERYTQMMQKGEIQYPYTLFLTPNSFRKGYEDHDYMPDLDEAVALIRGAGGVAVLAHYFTIRAKMPYEALERVLSEKRLDGVEVVYGLRDYGTDGEREMNEERGVLREMAKKYNLLAVGGSDAHTTEDLERYVANESFSKESIGFTEKVLATGKVNKVFSSLE